MYSYRHVSVKKKGRETIIDLSDSDCPWLDWPMGERQPRFHTYLLACFPWWIHSGAKGKGQECKWMTVAALKARDFIRDSTFMFWNNANDFACVVVSQYQSALQSITIALLLLRMRIVIKFNFRTEGLLETKLKSKLHTFRIPLKFKVAWTCLIR